MTGSSDERRTINFDVRDLMRGDAPELYREAKERALSATKAVRVQCSHCGKRNEVDVPDSRELIALTKLAAEHGFGRPHEAPKQPKVPPGGFSTAALEAMPDEELWALVGGAPESAASAAIPVVSGVVGAGPGR